MILLLNYQFSSANSGNPFLNVTDLVSPPNIFSTSFNTFSLLNSSPISIYLTLLPVLSTLTLSLLESSTPSFYTQSLWTDEFIQVTLKLKLDLLASSSFLMSFSWFSVYSSISLGEKTITHKTLSWPRQVSLALF